MAEEDPYPWEAQLDVLQAHAVLETLSTLHRAVLTMRYLDGCSVPEIAALLESTVHATEALLVRARRSFRHHYEGTSDV